MTDLQQGENIICYMSSHLTAVIPLAEQKGQYPNFLYHLTGLPETSQKCWRALYSGMFLTSPEMRQPVDWVIERLQEHMAMLAQGLQEEAAQAKVCAALGNAFNTCFPTIESLQTGAIDEGPE